MLAGSPSESISLSQFTPVHLSWLKLKPRQSVALQNTLLSLGLLYSGNKR
jgi:hypothetical protein